MAKRLQSEHLSAEIAGLNQLLATMPAEDLAGRIGLESLRADIEAQLQRLATQEEHVASIALLFGGRPVVGSVGIEADFASQAVSQFQQLITNIWGSAEGVELGSRGRVPEDEKSKLHITSLLHGSIGFLLEEVDENESLFSTPLKKAADKAAEVISAFATPDEQIFSAILETVDERVVTAARDFFKQMQRNGATLRLVEGDKEVDLQSEMVTRAYQRAESVSIDDSQREMIGELIGLIPYGRKFEFKDQEGRLISGTVAPTLSENYLERIESERVAGRNWRAKLRVRRVTRFGRTSESFTLLDLFDPRSQDSAS